MDTVEDLVHILKQVLEFSSTSKKNNTAFSFERKSAHGGNLPIAYHSAAKVCVCKFEKRARE